MAKIEDTYSISSEVGGKEATTAALEMFTEEYGQEVDDVTSVRMDRDMQGDYTVRVKADRD